MLKVRLPLLNDRHAHVSLCAALGGAADLSACTTRRAALAALKKQRGQLRLAVGWKDNFYDLGGPDFDALGPAAACNVSLHGFCFNAPARQLLAARCPEVAAGLDDPHWLERNLDRVFGIFTDFGRPGAIPAFMSRLASLGIWAAHDMVAGSDAAVRVLSRRYHGRVVLWAEPGRFAALGPAARAAVAGLKIFADGALGARTAALRRAYSSGGKGVLLHSDAGLKTLIKRCAALRGRLAIHAIGDAALEQVISVLESGALNKKLAVRVEHAQLITPAQARRAKKLGLALCMQPNFSSDSVFYADRLPRAYLRGNNPFRMLIDGAGFVPGQDLLLGSDGLPHGAAAALESALFPPFPEQRLTLGEFKAGYCLPDLSAGWMDAVIDEKKKKVSVKVGGWEKKPEAPPLRLPRVWK